jgi:hypothetical protein
MSATVRNAGHQWLVEVDGKLIGTASTEAEALLLAEQYTAQRKWVAVGASVHASIWLSSLGTLP